MSKKKKGDLVRNSKGQFVKGVSGNADGRPEGSKNRVTLMKIIAEEQFRGATADKIQLILHGILDAALEGDKQAQKLVWDAHISKANISEDKTAGSKQQINIRTMTIEKPGVIIDVEAEEVS